MNYDIPPECRPLGPYSVVSTRSALMLCIFSAFWLNWRPITVRQIRRELSSLRWVRIARAKTGFWFKYNVLFNGEKLWVEFFIRTCPDSICELEFLHSLD